jgi:hypothetical protein
MSGCASCCLGLLVLAAQILLNAAMALCFYWVIVFRSETKDPETGEPTPGFPFSWDKDPVKKFNLHPVLMIAAIYFMGQGRFQDSKIRRICYINFFIPYNNFQPS